MHRPDEQARRPRSRAIRSRGGTRTPSGGFTSGRSPSSPRSASTWRCSRQRRRRPGRHPGPGSRARPSTQLARLVRTLRARTSADPTLAAEGAARQLPRPRHRQAARAAGLERGQVEVPRGVRPDPKGEALWKSPSSRPAGSAPGRTAWRPTSPGGPNTATTTSKAHWPRSADDADPAEGPGDPRRPGGDADLRRQLEPLGLGRQDHRRPAHPRGQGSSPGWRDPSTSSSRSSKPRRARLCPALRRPGRPLLLRLGRHPRPPLRLGRPPGEPDDRPHGLPRQRVPRPRHLHRRPVRPARRTRSPTSASR